MKFKNLILSAAASVFTYSSVATANDFIDLNSNNVKVVFTEVVVDGETVKQATATVSETVNGVTTVKRQTEVIVPNGDGTYKRLKGGNEDKHFIDWLSISDGKKL